MTEPHSFPWRNRAPAFAAAALCFGAGLLVARQNAMRGFPDGRRTAFEECIAPGLALLPPALGFAALVFLLAATWPRHRRAASLLAPVPTLAALGHLAIAVRQTCHGPENGRGG